MRLPAIFFLFAAAVAPTALDYSPAAPSGGQIDTYLAARSSPLAGLGDSFEAYGRAYNVDPRLVVAIAGAETTFGQHLCGANNAWNWFHHRTCAASAFANFQEGAERVSRFLRRSYINRGYTTIPLIRHKYCARGCENWVPLVTRFHDEMPLRLPSSTAANPAGARGNRLFGVPLYLVFFGGAAVVALWALRALRG